MDGFLEQKQEKKGVNRGLVIGMFIGIVVIGLGIWLLTFQPSMKDQVANILEGSYQEDSPQFADLTKDIIISTSDKTVESPNAFGSISMYITGNIYNKGNKVINGLEVNVAVVDTFNQVLKEQRRLVVPRPNQPTLNPGETISVSLEIAGFAQDDDRANIRWKVTAIRVAN